MTRTALFSAIALLMTAGAAHAQGLGLPDFNQLANGDADGQTAGYIIQLFGVLTILAVAPGILITVTSFTRFIVVFSIMRTGLGLQTAPANLVLISLALFMTWYVMEPAANRAWEEGVQPLMEEEITQGEALQRIATPFREFMEANVREDDLRLFSDLALQTKDAADARAEEQPDDPFAFPSDQPDDPAAETIPNEAPALGAEQGPAVGAVVEAVPLRILVPAYMISELRRGFEIGFLVVLPFLVIDLVVATITMAMGMMMLPPTVLALPFKILFFILIDGWNLLVGSMVRSFV